MEANEALEYGIIDAVISSRDVVDRPVRFAERAESAGSTDPERECDTLSDSMNRTNRNEQRGIQSGQIR